MRAQKWHLGLNWPLSRANAEGCCWKEEAGWQNKAREHSLASRLLCVVFRAPTPGHLLCNWVRSVPSCKFLSKWDTCSPWPLSCYSAWKFLSWAPLHVHPRASTCSPRASSCPCLLGAQGLLKFTGPWNLQGTWETKQKSEKCCVTAWGALQLHPVGSFPTPPNSHSEFPWWWSTCHKDCETGTAASATTAAQTGHLNDEEKNLSKRKPKEQREQVSSRSKARTLPLLKHCFTLKKKKIFVQTSNTSVFPHLHLLALVTFKWENRSVFYAPFFC